MRKRILFVIPSFDINGFTSSALSILENLNQEEFDIYIFSLCDSGEWKTSFSNYKILPSSRLLHVFFVKFNKTNNDSLRTIIVSIKILKRICVYFHIYLTLCKLVFRVFSVKFNKKYSFDTVIAFAEGDVTEICSLLKARARYAWVHCDISKSDISLFYKERALDYYLKYKSIVCVSDHTKDVFILKFPLLASRVISIYNPINKKRIISLSHIYDNDNINDLFFSFKKKRILSIGRICDIKQFFLIPKIARKLLDLPLSFRWYIIGTGSEKDVSLILENIKIYNVEKYVFLLGEKSNPYSYLKNSDILVSTSKSEACPMIFNEANILDVPIASANFNTAYEFLDKDSISPIESLHTIIYRKLNNIELMDNKNIVDNDIIIEKIKNILMN